MPNFFERPELQRRPEAEPPGFDLLRDMLMRRAFALNANPYGMSPGGQANVGMMYPNRNFDPYGGYGGGWGRGIWGDFRPGSGWGADEYLGPSPGMGGGGGMQMGRGRRRMPWMGGAGLGPRFNPMPGYTFGAGGGGDQTQALMAALEGITKGPKGKTLGNLNLTAGKQLPRLGSTPGVEGRGGGLRTMPVVPRQREYFAPPGGRPPGQINPFGGASGAAKSMNPWTYDGEQVDYDATPWTPNWGPGIEPFAYGVSGAGGGFQWYPGGQEPAGSQTASIMSGISGRPPGPGMGTGPGVGRPGGSIGTGPGHGPQPPPSGPPPSLGKVPRNPVGPRFGIGGR